MSIRVMTLVWDDPDLSGSGLLGMLALADWSNDDGTSLHPSVRAFSRKCRLSEVQGRRVIRDLIEKGYLEVIGNHRGGAPGTTRQYRILLSKLRSGAARAANDSPEASTGPAKVVHTAIAHDSPTPITDESRPSQTALMDDRDGYRGRSETAITGESLTTIEPSVNRHMQHACGGEVLTKDPTPSTDANSPMSPGDISKSVIAWERNRRKKATSFSPSKQPVIDLACLRITAAELRRAYDDAVADREANAEPSPVNPGFVRVFVEKNRKPAPTVDPVRDDDWHRSETGIKRMAKKLGIGDGAAGGSWDQLKQRCFTRIAELKAAGVPR